MAQNKKTAAQLHKSLLDCQWHQQTGQARETGTFRECSAGLLMDHTERVICQRIRTCFNQKQLNCSARTQMKIGLISINTHTRVLNFASPIHTVAFQHFLEEHGIETTIIDY
jgi:hypothetical protein